jgi:(2Fe-2S) ferredoxin
VLLSTWLAQGGRCLRAEVAAQGLADQVQITACGSLGLCERGPNMVVYPEGVSYSRVAANDVHQLGRRVREVRRGDGVLRPDVCLSAYFPVSLALS